MPALWRRLQLALRSLGAWSSARVMTTLLLCFSAWIVLDASVMHLSSGLSKTSYDLMVRKRLWAAPADPRLVIVDIDEASLARMSAEFGRWPWPRDTLATVLDHLERQQVQAVVWDVLFSDPDRLNPGGDAAWDAAVRRSRHSHFSVVRLPAAHDADSQIRRSALPELWAHEGAAASATVAVIPPFLASMAQSPLGLTNAQPDADGVLRRFRDTERLSDGSLLQTLPLSVLHAVAPTAHQQRVAMALQMAPNATPPLIAWREREQAYPHIAFADLFAVAEGQPPAQAVPDLAGRIVLIGASAPTLHDIHPTALSASQAGIEVLATLIDNEIHQRHIHELPLWVQAGLAMALCLLIALISHFRSLSAVDPWMVGLPLGLTAISYLSLHSDQVFLDLHLASGWALAFMALLRVWQGLRLDHWCSLPLTDQPALGLMPLRLESGWSQAMRNRLITLLERQAPDCRILQAAAATHADWPELNQLAVLVGPPAQLEALAAHWPTPARWPGLRLGPCQALGPTPARTDLLITGLAGWQDLLKAPRTAKEHP